MYYSSLYGEYKYVNDPNIKNGAGKTYVDLYKEGGKKRFMQVFFRPLFITKTLGTLKIFWGNALPLIPSQPLFGSRLQYRRPCGRNLESENRLNWRGGGGVFTNPPPEVGRGGYSPIPPPSIGHSLHPCL